MIYYAQTMPGVEEIAWLEIRDRLRGAHFQRYLFAREQNGIVVFDYAGPAQDLLRLRTTEDVFSQIAYHDDLTRLRRDLRLLGELVEKSEGVGQMVNDYLRIRRFSAPPTFRVISRQYGKFEYTRKELTATLWRSLKARYPRWTPVADDAQVEFWANLLGSQFLLGARLSDRTMRHRFERKVELPASLRPSVAAAMVLLTEPGPDDIFLDPMCGSGTILYERMQAGPYGRVLGGDIDPERVDAARKNVRGNRKSPARPTARSPTFASGTRANCRWTRPRWTRWSPTCRSASNSAGTLRPNASTRPCWPSWSASSGPAAGLCC